VTRVFLDANILFSAAYREGAGLAKLWSVAKVQLVSSVYAVEEARRNLSADEQLKRLNKLAKSLELVTTVHQSVALPGGIMLDEKDRPILAAAVGSKCAFLITGDSDFNTLFRKTVQGVTIVRARDFFREHGK
jgi:predicted nucleic acid-binding protein